MDGDATEGGLPPSRTHSRMPSTVTCQSDVPAASTASYATDLPGDIPIPDVEDKGTGASSSSKTRGKRKHEGDEGDEARGDDPANPEDNQEMGSVEVYGLGERKAGDGKRKGQIHQGKYDLCELFSPPRVAEAARARGIRGGWSLDKLHEDPITGQCWILSDKAIQGKVWKMIRRDQPLVIGLSPECTLFSSLQTLRKTEIPPADLAEAIECIKCCVEVAEYQRKKNRYFYFEHPLIASSWQLPCLAGLMEEDDVIKVVVHMCQFSLQARDAEWLGFAKKPTRVLTNLPSIAESIGRTCAGDHRHVHLISGKAKAAAQYTNECCNAIIDGVVRVLELTRQVKEQGLNYEAIDIQEVEDQVDEYGYGEAEFRFRDDVYCVDDVRGGHLPMELVRSARQKEMEGFAARRVYQSRPRWEATASGSKVIGVRLVDTAKADKVRSRLVAQDFNTDRGKVDELFAATPPLLAARCLCSRAASQGIRGQGSQTLMTLNFCKAFLYGNVDRDVYIELPDEDSMKGDADVVGKLVKSMYGLRDAPQIWQKVVRDMLEQRGYKALLGTQCTYVHKVTGVTIVAHVDDFLVLGTEMQLRELIASLQAEYECTGRILGRGKDVQPELKFLGRTITLEQNGIAWEGNKRHVKSFFEKLSEEFMDVEEGKKSRLKGAKTPGVKQDHLPEIISLNPVKSKAYRGLVALANFVAQDMADIGYAAKEVSKHMSEPAECDVLPLKRLGRYLAENPRLL